MDRSSRRQDGARGDRRAPAGWARPIGHGLGAGLGRAAAPPPGSILVRPRAIRHPRTYRPRPLSGRRRRAPPSVLGFRFRGHRGGRLHADRRAHRVRSRGRGGARRAGPHPPGWRARRGHRGRRASPRRRTPRRGRRGPMAPGCLRRRQAISLPPREVRDRRREGGLDRIGELRGFGLRRLAGREPRVVRLPRRSVVGDSIARGVRRRLR